MEELVSKTDVEELLHQEITEEEFQNALEHAKRKQRYIFNNEQRAVVLEPWYLAILTKEYVISLAFQKFTVDLCEKLRNMEKECSVNKDQNTLVTTHIVPQTIA